MVVRLVGRMVGLMAMKMDWTVVESMVGKSAVVLVGDLVSMMVEQTVVEWVWKMADYSAVTMADVWADNLVES